MYIIMHCKINFIAAQNVTIDKYSPSWLTSEDLMHLNRIKDFIENLLVNTMEKRRLAAGDHEEEIHITREF